MSSEQQEHYLLSKRDETERNRLNFQHNIHKKVLGGRLIHPTIPKNDVKRVADICTGTGVWLEEVATEIAQSGNTNELELIGFDISDVQWVKSNPKGAQLVLSDVHQGFPEEYHGTFDIVHARLLIVVITETQWPKAVSNIVKLLKPGGYLQWDDLDFQDDILRIFPTNKNGDEEYQSDAQLIFDFYESQGWSLHLLDKLSNTLNDLPVENERRADYVQVAYLRPDLGPGLIEWIQNASIAVLTPVLLRSGKSGTEDEAKDRVEKFRKTIEAMWKEGSVFPMPMGTLVARKKA